MADDNWDLPEGEDFELDTSGTTKDDLGSDAGNVEHPGYYHFEVAEVTPELDTLSDGGQEKSPCIRFDMCVLETVQGQSAAGARLFHRLYVGSKGGKEVAKGSKQSALRFGLGMGLLREKSEGGEIVTAVDVTDPAGNVLVPKGSTKIPTRLWLMAKSKQCIGKVALEKGTGNYGDKYVIPFGRVYALDNPNVADVPKNLEMLELIGRADLVAAEKARRKGGGKSPPAATPANGAKGKPAKGGAKSASAAPPDEDADLAGL